MDGYAVKVDELGKLIDDLGTAADRMADANKKLGGGGAFGSLGTAELGKAGVEFEEAWGYGIGRLGEAASGIAERLKEAKEKYEQIEAQFGGELGKFGPSPVGGGHPGGARGHYPVVGQPAVGPVGGGYTGGVPGIDRLAEPTSRERGAPGVDGQPGSSGDSPVGGGATGGITDLLNGLDR
ncbi:hypothetical protein [Amycolatopsis rifamycinica]|uniref:Uncharacterized protein n=1 Tax=Amycolatopsis rifamycinica TaxID=287986 RepID=A0A066UI49_9PSEU|nr:hypothetical protein [Amycolatopsis rifamycinica]KDN23913.1 hypothetical protein DV20_02315 [Amycolatopsis rifamycinica]